MKLHPSSLPPHAMWGWGKFPGYAPHVVGGFQFWPTPSMGRAMFRGDIEEAYGQIVKID